MKTKGIIIILSLCCILTACRDDGVEKPNIILILADDLGYGDLGCYGNPEILTPHLDSLAANGIRFTDFHSSGPVCSPTRAALMSGQYPQRTGLEGVIYVKGETRRYGMSPSVLTLAEVLKQGGYSTGILGKWHLGYDEKFNPVHQGFDEFIGYRSGNIDYHSHYDNAGIFDWYGGLDTLKEEGYVTDLITTHAVEFIDRNRDRPFFLYVAHEAPHAPFQGRHDPPYRFPGREFSYYGPAEDVHGTYREMVEVMDEGIGRIMEALKEKGLLGQTLVIFLSDNGGVEGIGDNGMLKGAKGNLFEGGHRVPAMAYWKGMIRPGLSDELLVTFDLFPTFLKLCGVERPGSLETDGRDFSPHLLSGTKLPERTLFWRYRDQKVARKGPVKLILTATDSLLFDLDLDPREKNNIAAERPGIMSSLMDSLAAWEKEMSEYEMICP